MKNNFSREEFFILRFWAASIVLIVIATAAPIPIEAQPHSFDLWVSRLHVDPQTGNYEVWWRKQGPETLPYSCQGAVLINGSVDQTFSVGNEANGHHSGTTISSIQLEDTVRVVVDYGSDFLELDEDNNWLEYRVPANYGSDPNGDYPNTLTTLLSSMTMLECTGRCKEIQSGKYPFALLILPPFNWAHINPEQGDWATILELGEFNGQETETSSGVTASLAIEAGFESDITGSEAYVGAQFSSQFATAIGESVERSYANTYSASLTTNGEHTVVLCQTRYDLCEYEVIEGSETGDSVWVAVPQKPVPGYTPNPNLVTYRLSDYATQKATDACDLYAAHEVGNSSSHATFVWPGPPFPYVTSPWEHITNYTNRYHQGGLRPWLVLETRTISTGGHEWSETITQENSYSRMASFEYNMYAGGGCGGVSAEVSFGSIHGRSHKIWNGNSATFSWVVGPVTSADYEYDVVAFAENLIFEHDNRDQIDGLLLMCYYIKNGASGLPGSSWHSNIEDLRSWQDIVSLWPGKDPYALLDDYAYSVDTELIDNAHYYYQHFQDISDDFGVWAAQFNESEVNNLQDFIDANNELSTTLGWVMGQSPTSTDYSFMSIIRGCLQKANAWGVRVFDPDPARIYPDPPVQGGTTTIEYNAVLGELPETAMDVYLNWSYDGSPEQQESMSYSDTTGMWSIEIAVPGDAMILDYYFDDGVTEDNRNGLYWHAETAGILRTHDNGNLALSLSSQGILGFTDEAQSDGMGFTYNGSNWLHIGGLWVGGGGGELGIHEWVANRDYDAESELDWVVASHYSPSGIFLWEPSSPLTTQLSHAVYCDSGAADPHGVLVYQIGTSRIAPDDEFVIINYHIRNEGQHGMNLYVGQFADFEMGSPADQDWGGTDIGRSLAYMYRDGSTPYVGVCMLDAPLDAPSTVTLVDKSAYGSYIPDEEKHSYLSGQPGYVFTNPGTSSDWGVLVASGPFWLSKGSGVTFSFAVAAGADLSSLQANVDIARNWWSQSFNITGIDLDTSEIARCPELFQNYPNPFNPITEISFFIPFRTNVRLQIYDVSGRLVRSLRDEVMDAGKWSVPWDGRNDNGKKVCSGIYFYHLVTDSAKQSRKMVILR